VGVPARTLVVLARASLAPWTVRFAIACAKRQATGITLVTRKAILAVINKKRSACERFRSSSS